MSSHIKDKSRIKNNRKTPNDGLSKIIFNKIPKGVFKTPFGKKVVINTDSTASGYVFEDIENYMNKHILPFYNNTHSNCYTGQLMSKHITNTYKILRKTMNCKKHDKIILTGSGCTGAVNHLVHLLKIDPENTEIILSIVEHHSNALPWRETKAHVDFIGIDELGLFDTKQLTQFLEQTTQKYKTVYVSLSAGSNVTGVLQDTHTLCKIVHKFKNAHIFFDFACVAPYIPINLHTRDKTGDFIDGLFFSPHKFLGGQSTTGVLVVPEKLVCCTCPYQSGGGIVRIVSNNEIDYSQNLESREIAGTPNILGMIRLGKVFQLKNKLGAFIEKREKYLTRKCQSALEKFNLPNLTLYNPKENLHRLPIFVFNITGLHHNLVVKMLSDLFGIQTRGGVSCCNLYAHKLLGCDCKKYDYAKKCIDNKKGVPEYYGFVRVSFNYCLPEYVINYVLNAIKFVAEHGSSLAHKYSYVKEENRYIYRGFDDFKENDIFSDKNPTIAFKKHDGNLPLRFKM